MFVFLSYGQINKISCIMDRVIDKLTLQNMLPHAQEEIQVKWIYESDNDAFQILNQHNAEMPQFCCVLLFFVKIFSREYTLNKPRTKTLVHQSFKILLYVLGNTIQCFLSNIVYTTQITSNVFTAHFNLSLVTTPSTNSGSPIFPNLSKSSAYRHPHRRMSFHK